MENRCLSHLYLGGGGVEFKKRRGCKALFLVIHLFRYAGRWFQSDWQISRVIKNSCAFRPHAWIEREKTDKCFGDETSIFVNLRNAENVIREMACRRLANDASEKTFVIGWFTLRRNRNPMSRSALCLRNRSEKHVQIRVKNAAHFFSIRIETMNTNNRS